MPILIPDQQNVLDSSQRLARRSLTEPGRNPWPEEIDPLSKAVWRWGTSGPRHEAAPTGVLSRPERLFRCTLAGSHARLDSSPS